MGRKPKASKLEVAIQRPENLSVPSKMERLEPEKHKISNSLSVRKKSSKVKTMIARRSDRLKNSVQPKKNRKIETIVEPINLVESEKEDEPNPVECEREDDPNLVEEREYDPLIEGNYTKPNPGGKSLEEKLDQLVEGVKELKSMATKRNLSGEGSSCDLNYKNLYISSQKKIEALIDENDQIREQLHIAQAKIEAYENVKEVMEKLKDVIVVSNLTKATEAMVNLSSHAIVGGFSFPNAAVEPNHAVVSQPQAKKKRRGKKSKLEI